MEPFDDMQPTPVLPCFMPLEPEALAAQERMRVTAAVRSRTNKVTALSFLYIAILTACVSAAGVVSMLLMILLDPTILRLGSEVLTSRLMEAFTQATFGYLLAVPAIFLMVFIWKKKAFIRNVLFAARQRMTPGVLLFLISLLFLAQAVTDVYVRG